MSDSRSSPRFMHFLGVRTSGSSARKRFPQWADVLGLGEAHLVGIDLPLGAPDVQYRDAVQQIKEDPAVAGALVTSHKLNVVRAAGDLFDVLSDEAALCGEVSAIYKRDGLLCGHACDPATSGLAMTHFLGPTYWQQHSDAAVLSLGAGGAAVAWMVHLLTQAADRPKRVILVDIDMARLDHLQAIIGRFPTSAIECTLVHNADPAVNDALMADLPPHSLVVNATGMGKDRPGSPVTDAGVFPQDGAVWELNYRGERRFLQQARHQAARQGLAVADGWYYFLLGWSTVISYVFDVTITPALFERFAAVSEAMYA